LKIKELAIIIDHLTKNYEDVTALEDLSLQIDSGELFGLLGPNGVEKITTINILCGLTKPTSGSAKVGHSDIQKETKKVEEMIGVCPQEIA
jgi:ABC-2 type transport system ATP-binding protein